MDGNFYNDLEIESNQNQNHFNPNENNQDNKDNKNNIKDFIDDLFYPSLNIIKHEIHSIKEEAEIYGNE